MADDAARWVMRFNALLDSQPSVATMLQDDDLLARLRVGDPLAMSYFSQKSILITLLEYAFLVDSDTLYRMHTAEIVNRTPPAPEVAERVKLAMLSGQVLTCGARGLLDPFFDVPSDRTLLEKLLTPLTSGTPVDSVVAANVGAVLTALHKLHAQELLDYLGQQTEIVARLVAHIETSAVVDLIVDLARWSQQSGSPVAASWMAARRLVPLLVDRVAPTGPFEPANSERAAAAQGNALHVLRSILSPVPAVNPQTPPPPYPNTLTIIASSPETVGRLINYTLAPPAAGLSRSPALLLLTDIVCLFASPGNAAEPTAASSARPLMAPPELGNVNGILPAFHTALAHWAEILAAVPDSPEQTFYGGRNAYAPLGLERYQLTALLPALLCFGDDTMCDAFLESGVVSRAIDLFFTYPFHSALHEAVTTLIRNVLHSQHVPLMRSLVERDTLHLRILTAFNEASTARVRPGYLGFAGSIAGSLACTRELNDILYDRSEAWREFLNGPLADHTIRERTPICDSDKLPTNKAAALAQARDDRDLRKAMLASMKEFAKATASINVGGEGGEGASGDNLSAEEQMLQHALALSLQEARLASAGGASGSTRSIDSPAPFRDPAHPGAMFPDDGSVPSRPPAGVAPGESPEEAQVDVAAEVSVWEATSVVDGLSEKEREERRLATLEGVGALQEVFPDVKDEESKSNESEEEESKEESHSMSVGAKVALTIAAVAGVAALALLAWPRRPSKLHSR